MSEINLIKNLEKLKNIKPNQEWVNFTYENILNSDLETKPSFFQRVNILTYAPLTICVFLAVIVGSSITKEETPLQIAETEPKEEIEIKEEPVKQEPQIASINKVEEEIIVEDKNLSVIITEEILTKEIELRVEQLRSEVMACKRIEQEMLALSDEKKEICQEFEDQLNQLEEILGSENH